MTGPRKFLFVDLCNDPGSDRIVAELGRLGAHCELIAPPSSFAAKSRFVRKLYPLAERGGAALRGLQLGRRLAAIVAASRPDILVPLDDLAARALRDVRLYRRAGPDLRALLKRSLGAPEHFDEICSRQGVLALAERIGVRAPRAVVVPSLAVARRAAETLGYPVVLKREQSAGGAGVVICRDARDLTRAYRHGLAIAWAKRRLAAIPGFRANEATPLILQAFIPGQLAFRVSACADGIELDGADFAAERRDPFETSASAYVSGVANAEMRDATRALISALRCSGFVSLDFIVTAAGEAYLLELNARPIGSGHLGRLFGHDILSALLRRCAAAPPPGPPPRLIALFPKALDRGGAIEPSRDVWHDEPADDPKVLEAYRAWLGRRHPERRPAPFPPRRASAG